MKFASDNWAGVPDAISAAIANAGAGFAPAYGGDELTQRVTERFSELFERDVEVFFTATGTASNSLALAAAGRPGGLILCSSEAHIDNSEWGATEFQSGGVKLITMPTRDGKILPEGLAATLARFPDGNRYGRVVALSLTNATECGTVYSAAEVAALAAPLKARGVPVHCDGARFANAVAATGATPAELTWKSGVDFMSFGGTKNGCWAAEAIISFTPGVLHDLEARRQRAGHTMSKARFIAAQFEAYLENGNWLSWARHANAMSEKLRIGLRASNSARLAWESTANEVFPIISRAALANIRAAGGFCHEWPADALPLDARPGPDETLVRLVTTWATSETGVEQFLALV
jgi:threonine aldolase